MRIKSRKDMTPAEKKLDKIVQRLHKIVEKSNTMFYERSKPYPWIIGNTEAEITLLASEIHFGTLEV